MAKIEAKTSRRIGCYEAYSLISQFHKKNQADFKIKWIQKCWLVRKIYQKKAASDGLEERRKQFERAQTTSELQQKTLSSQEQTHQQNLAEQLIRMLAPAQRAGEASPARELSALNRLTSAVAESVEQGILSEEEAEIVLQHALSNFVEKRMEEVVDNLFSEPDSRWFLAASHHRYE